MNAANRASGTARGRDSISPRQIPLAGWRDIVWRLRRDFQRDRITLAAAAVAFYSMLSLFPALSVALALYGLIADPESLGQQLEVLADLVPASALALVESQARELASQSTSVLSFSALGALVIALWGARKAALALIEACNLVYGEAEDRGFLRLNLLALSFTVAALIGGLLAVALLLIVPVVVAVVASESGVGWSWSWLRWPLLALLFAGGLAVLYRFAPNRELARWSWVSTGSLVATALWMGGSALFSWYTANLGRYNETYGAVSSVIVLLLWLYVTAIAVLLGGKLNAEVEHQTARDSTVGEEAPMGERGAHVADTLGESR